MPTAKLNGLSDLPAAKVAFIKPMYADATNVLPEGDEWRCEVKLDGYPRARRQRFNRRVAVVA